MQLIEKSSIFFNALSNCKFSKSFPTSSSTFQIFSSKEVSVSLYSSGSGTIPLNLDHIKVKVLCMKLPMFATNSLLILDWKSCQSKLTSVWAYGVIIDK